MTIKRLLRKARRGFATRVAPVYSCEPLEPRTLFNVIAINGTAGNDVITLSSHNVIRFGIHQVLVDWSINGGPNHSAGVLPTDSVFVDTGTGTDEVNVLSTVAGVGTTIQGDSATDDILNIGGGPNGLQGIQGSITVASSAALWGITADDGNDTTARTGTLSDGSLTGLAPANITWDPAKCTGLLIDTGKGGGNTLTVLQTNVSTQIQAHSSGSDDSLIIGNPTDGVADITTSLSIGNATPNPAGLFTLTVDDSGSQVIHQQYVFEDGSLSVAPFSLSPPPGNITWSSTAVRSLMLKSAAKENFVRVDYTDVPTTIIGNALEEVDVGEMSSALGIHQNLYLTNLAGTTELAVRRFATDPAAPTVTLHTIAVSGDPSPYGAIDGLAPATIAYRYADVQDVVLDLNLNQVGQATVDAKATGSPVQIQGAQTVNVGDAGSTRNIVGAVDIFFAATTTIDDSSDPVSRNATLSLTKLSVGGTAVAIGGLSPGAIRSAAPSLVINGGVGSDDFTVNAPPSLSLQPAQISVVLNTGTANSAVQVLAAAFGAPLTINGQGGNDAFTVNYSDSIRDNLVFHGGAGLDTLHVVGLTPDTPFSVAPGAITFGQGTAQLTTTYSAIKTLAFDGGSFTVTGDLNGVNLSTLGFSTLKIQASTNLGAVSLGDGTQATLVAGALPLNKTLFCTGLSISGSGKLDLANNALQLTYSGADPVAAVRSYLSSGYNNGTWNGSGIVTSAGDASHALGFGDSADGVVPGLPANTISVRWTRLGDVNLDGKVGFADLVAVARNYGKTGRNWDQGDQNYDGAVGFDDLVTVARNYGATAAVRAASAMLFAAPLEMPIKTRKRR